MDKKSALLDIKQKEYRLRQSTSEMESYKRELHIYPQSKEYLQWEQRMQYIMDNKSTSQHNHRAHGPHHSHSLAKLCHVLQIKVTPKSQADHQFLTGIDNTKASPERSSKFSTMSHFRASATGSHFPSSNQFQQNIKLSQMKHTREQYKTQVRYSRELLQVSNSVRKMEHSSVYSSDFRKSSTYSNGFRQPP